MDLLTTLNKPQREAVTITEGPVLILAGPGSGKTRVITHRIAYLVREKGIAPWSILAVTFTNKAAKEMQTRLEVLLSPAQAKTMTIGTFHSLCARVLRREGDYLSRYGLTSKFLIFDQADQAQLVKQALAQVDVSDLSLDSPHTLRASEIQEKISRAKSHMLQASRMAEEARTDVERLAARVMPVYNRLLRACNAVDFDDLLLFTEHCWRQHPERLREYQSRWHYIHVDEFQDCNLPQYKLVRLLSYGTNQQHEGKGNVCVVGDDDQMIYTWRGASAENVVRFEQDFPQCKLVMLEQNYRSTKTIIQAAQALVEKNAGRKEKRLWTENPAGSPIAVEIYPDDRDEAQAVARAVKQIKDSGEIQCWRDAAILYRMNAMSRALEEQLRWHSIPYLVIGSRSFYDRKEIKDILAYLRVIYNPEDDVALLRIINVPTRKIGALTVKMLQAWAVQQKCSIWQAIASIEGCSGLKSGQKRSLAQFGQLVEGLRAQVNMCTLPDLFDALLDQTAYLAFLEADSSDIDRKANIEELRRVALEFAEEEPETALQEFLERIALVGGTEVVQDSGNGKLAREDQDAVRLMTLHAAKGLEFPAVFLVGMVEGCLPHSRAWTPEELEEERRLAYVGLTRAMRLLALSGSEQRYVQGEVRASDASRFLDEISEYIRL